MPDLKSLEEIEKIKLGDKAWQEITWGDFVDKSGDFSRMVAIADLDKKIKTAKDLKIELI